MSETINKFVDEQTLRKYILTTDYLLQNRNGIQHLNLMEFIKSKALF